MAKKALKIILGAIVALALIVAGYVAYVLLSYERIEDNLDLEVTNNQNAVMEAGEEYTALTYNIGFGAYTPDYTFFMDEGEMKDGTKTKGTSSWAASKDSVVACTEGDIDILQKENVDFALLQEVDTNSTRSYGVNQVELIEKAFDDCADVEAVDYHSAFLFYPITQPHGASNSSLLTLSSKKVKSATRFSYPVSDGLDKLTDLDRCFSAARIPVSNGKELVLINSHMSAYDKGGKVRAMQLKTVAAFMTEEAAKGNYVIMGGDFNHSLSNSLGLYETQEIQPGWVSELTEEDLGIEHFSIVRADNIEDVATCRSSDIPYEQGVTYTATIDGFIVSDNVTASATNIDSGFQYSDHNPVKLTFSLK